MLLSSHRFTASVLVFTILIFTITQNIWYHWKTQNTGNSLSSHTGRSWPSSLPSPIDLNWRSSLLYHSKITDPGTGFINTEEHRRKIEGTILQYPRIHVLLRYMACQGLFNQMYAHLSAFILAELLKADVVMPPSLFRPVRLIIIYCLPLYFQCSNTAPS